MNSAGKTTTRDLWGFYYYGDATYVEVLPHNELYPSKEIAIAKMREDFERVKTQRKEQNNPIPETTSDEDDRYYTEMDETSIAVVEDDSRMGWSLFTSQIAETAEPVSQITPWKIQRAEQCLIDNGIDEDEADIVLQALGYILLARELYPNT